MEAARCVLEYLIAILVFALMFSILLILAYSLMKFLTADKIMEMARQYFHNSAVMGP